MKGLCVWRICFNGDLRLQALPYGSTLGPGRWHLPPPSGVPVVYAAASRALAQLEKRAHANGIAPANQALIRLELPDTLLQDAAQNYNLQTHWRDSEAYTQALGVQWGRATTSLGLWVPSFLEPQERNLLINPAHPRYTEINIVTEAANFEFDRRLFS